ncbi:MAG TPA: efflux transporter outer membrane subunit [Bryobacteraceae bacterium]|nr:efflux transporter outer membrane subunit [Bryobacteraceae bacterium]
MNLTRSLARALVSGWIILSCGCAVGPRYQRPSAPVPTAFKEPPPPGWKEAQPNDGVIRGKWWELYNDPELNALEEQLIVSNQNVLQAEAQFHAARDAVRIARAALFPVIGAAPSITASRAGSGFGNNSSGQSGTSSTQSGGSSSGVRTNYNLPFDFSYQVDLWGSIRRSVRQSAETAQASAAQLENVRLTLQSELAQDYFQLRGVDGNRDLLEKTVASYGEYLQLTRNRFNGGVASGADVAQAETQLNSAKEQLIDVGVARAQFEHAVAVLTGKPPAELTIAFEMPKSLPPPIPIGVPSTLLERRPDIAQAERQMSAVHEQIGIAQAEFFPALTLTATAGLQASSFLSWFTWPSRFWSVGAGLSETLFDAGRRRGQVSQARDVYEAAQAGYRQTVLTAFQQVEDNLAASRILAEEAVATDATIASAQRSLDISTYQYKAGTANYLQVLLAQTALLGEQRAALSVLTRRMVSSVLLIEALGGGWEASRLPTVAELAAKPK